MELKPNKGELVFKNNIALLSGLLFATASLADTNVSAEDTKSEVNVYNPTTVCELLQDITAANGAAAAPSIINLGGLVFELQTDCATQVCPGTVTCGSYPDGPNGLPEITSPNMSIVNGRIVRSDTPIPPATKVPFFRIVDVASTGELNLFKVTLENGDAEPYPAGCLTAVPPDCVDTGNGGGAFVEDGGSLGLVSSKIGFNIAANSGGGIYTPGGSVVSVTLSIISHNIAYAGTPEPKMLDAVNTKIPVPDQPPPSGGGGLYIGVAAPSGLLAKQVPAQLTMISSTVSNNSTPSAGGGLENLGQASIYDSTFSYNTTCVAVAGSGECGPGFNPSGAGGGIYNDGPGTLILTQNTFWANRALMGGGVYNEAFLADPAAFPCNFTTNEGVCLNNNTIANNFAQMGGGGLFNSNDSGNDPPTPARINQLVSNLIAGNTDYSGLAPDFDNQGSINNSTDISAPANPPVPIVAEGFNLIGNCGTAGQCGLANEDSPTPPPYNNFDIVGGVDANGITFPVVDPRLHYLRNNGGPTETVALFPDSPAVNNGFNNLSLQYDQRGPNFFRTVAQTDIGSFEYQYDEI